MCTPIVEKMTVNLDWGNRYVLNTEFEELGKTLRKELIDTAYGTVKVNVN
jgi:hypothetical protein